MALPATGTTFAQGGYADLSPEFLRRGKNVCVATRDARGAATNISPHDSTGAVLFSPFAQDLQLRADLFARRRVGGYWVTVTDQNEGWLNVGAFKDGNGPTNKPKVTNDHFMVLQLNNPYDSDLTEESEGFSFVPVDTANPWVKRLRYNRRLADDSGNLLVEDPGATNAGFSRLLNALNPGRQFLFVRERKWNGLSFITVTGYALARLDDIGNSKFDKKDSEGAELTYLPVDDGFFMGYQDGEYQPILVHEWYGGSGWASLGGVPILSTTPPVATATTTGKATVAFTNPAGTGDPWTITAESTVDDGTTWIAAVLDTPNAVTSASGTTTVKVKSVTSGSTKFRAKVVGTNGASAYTPKSNAVTIS